MDEVAVFAAARFLASAINPAFVVALIVAPLVPRRLSSSSLRARASTRDYLKRIGFSAIGVAVPVVLAEAGKKYQVWDGHSSFPSGHETFAASAAVCLIVCHPRLAPLALSLAAAMGWALVRAGYHTMDDVAGAIVLGALCATLIALALRVPEQSR